MKQILGVLAAVSALCAAFPSRADDRGCFRSQSRCLRTMARSLRHGQDLRLRAFCLSRNEVGRYDFRFSDGYETFYRGHPRTDAGDPEEPAPGSALPDLDRDSCLGSMAQTLEQVFAITFDNYCQENPGRGSDGVLPRGDQYCFDYTAAVGC